MPVNNVNPITLQDIFDKCNEIQTNQHQVKLQIGNIAELAADRAIQKHKDTCPALQHITDLLKDNAKNKALLSKLLVPDKKSDNK